MRSRWHECRITKQAATKIDGLLPDGTALRFDPSVDVRRQERLEGPCHVVSVGAEHIEPLIDRVAAGDRWPSRKSLSQSV